jgi:hypothetical protein
MRSLAIALAVLIAFGSIGNAEAQNRVWYYCDSAHAYYPYVRYCATPWRAVQPTTQSAQQTDPAPTTTPAVPQSSSTSVDSSTQPANPQSEAKPDNTTTSDNESADSPAVQNDAAQTADPADQKQQSKPSADDGTGGFSWMWLLVGLFIFGISLTLYFIPTMIAFARNHKNAVAILALNFLMGWTFIGWVASLVWALKD